MIVSRHIPRLVVFFIALVWMGGCVQTKTTPGYARAGDHIVMGLGGIERNAGGDSALKPSDLTITLTDFSGQQHTLEPRLLFKSYADYSALMNLNVMDGLAASIGLVGMVPYDSGWFAVAPLTYPGQYDAPLPLAVGAATISVTSPKLTNTASPFEGSLNNIPIEIIAGTSPEDEDFVKQFFNYIRTANSFTIAPNNLSGIDAVGGAYLVINYSDDTFFSDGRVPVVVPSDHNPYVQINYNVVPNGDGTGSIYVTLLNPQGFRTLATATPSSSLMSDLSVNLNYFSGGTAAQAKTNFSLVSVDSYYIDMTGAVLPGVSPVLTHFEDL
jgi:hypothetical protein